MNEEDIKKQLEVKNKEIYLNKLNIDLDNNLEVLVLTLENLLKTQEDNLLKKTIEIVESFKDEKEIKEKVEEFIKIYYQSLLDLLTKKKEELKSSLSTKLEISIYKEKIDSKTKDLEIDLIDSSKTMINDLILKLNSYLETPFQEKRLNSYLNEIYLLNLNNKVMDTIKSRDIMLYNTFNETYLKYLELNKNTVGI